MHYSNVKVGKNGYTAIILYGLDIYSYQIILFKRGNTARSRGCNLAVIIQLLLYIKMSAGHRNALCEQHDHNTNHKPFDMNNYQLFRSPRNQPKSKVSGPY